MKPLSYIGITGFKEDYEVHEAAALFMHSGFLGPDCGFTAQHHQPMFGFLCSAKRLADPTTQGTHSQRAQDLGCLTRYCPRGSLPAIHYFTNNRQNLGDEVSQVFDIDNMYERNFCRALQINMAWPQLEQLTTLRQRFPDLTIIMQLPQETLTQIHRVAEYQEHVEYCLIDPSGGKGMRITQEHLDLAQRIQELLPRSRIGIAGGLDGYAVQDAMSAVYQNLHDSFCIDAQGKLRADDRGQMDMEKVRHYIAAAAYGIRLGEKFFL
ncbi:hypothetical protein GF342_05710 [Candidatus Woesearchaeota archaeon]|nr:hypothetical protein [Candidatus Woesearchaeota archaeon]